MLYKFSCGSHFIGPRLNGLGQWLIQSKFLIPDLQRFLWTSPRSKDFTKILLAYFVFWRKQKAGELDFEESGIVFPGRRDTIVSYNNALFLQRERKTADLVEPLFGNRCSIIRSDLRHCSAFTQLHQRHCSTLLTWDIVQYSPTTRQQPQCFHKLPESCFLEMLSKSWLITLWNLSKIS